MDKAYFKSVRALPGYKLEVVMHTGAVILFDFQTRLRSVRFWSLRDEELFRSVRTNGYSLMFGDGEDCLRIEAPTFLDLVLVDRTKSGPYPFDM